VKLTDRYLNKQFKVFNKKYFGNKLLNVRVYFKRMDSLGMTVGIRYGDTSEDSTIYINRRLNFSRAAVKQTLLHEMVHVEKPQWQGHGYHFDRRMLKLAKAGAFNGYW